MPKRKREDQAGSFMASALRCVLQSRLQRILDALHQGEPNCDTLATIAVSVTHIEKAMDISYEIPHPLYSELERGRLKCQFRNCEQETSNIFNFNTHLKRFHSDLRPFIQETVCPLCGVHCRTPKALNCHEKSEHSATYKSRPEIFTPFFCPFQHNEQCLKALGGNSESLSTGISSGKAACPKEMPFTSSTATATVAAKVTPNAPNDQGPGIPGDESDIHHVDFGLDTVYSNPFSTDDMIPCSIDPSEIAICNWDLPPDFTFIAP